MSPTTLERNDDAGNVGNCCSEGLSLTPRSPTLGRCDCGTCAALLLRSLARCHACKPCCCGEGSDNAVAGLHAT